MRARLETHAIRPSRPGMFVLWVLAAMAAGAGCGGSAGPAGLAADPIPGPGDYRRTLVFDGFDRAYEIHVPPSWRRGARLPVVLAFHGIAGNPAGMRRITRFDAFADREGFLAVYPQAGAADWSTGCEACGSDATLLRIDDVGFVRALLMQLDLDVGIDGRRVYAVGLSNGALLVHRVACDASDAIAAFVSVGATMLDPRFVPRCSPSRAVPFVFVHGTEDGLFPPGGGGFVLSIQETVATWVAHNGCDTTPATVDLPDLVQDGTTVRRFAYGDCASGGEVIFYEVTGGGHTWPGTPGGGSLGNVSMDFDASQVTADFVRNHSLPSRTLP